ncbi:MAG: hypothetical protein Q4C11_04660 [Clostridium sp.]|nr:hypothetical protein [Clostridium sp.]
MQKKSTRNKNLNRRKTIILLILILIFAIATPTLGRYVITGINNFFLRTKEFYFYSDKLKDIRAVYQIDNWTGVDPYTITVHMNSIENNLKKSTYDISYSISYTCSQNATCQLSKETGIIPANNNDDYFNIIITPNIGLTTGDKVSVEIIATSTSKYQKKLTAMFVLVVGKEKTSYEIVDSVNSKYLDLNITNTLSYYNVETAFGNYSVGDRIDVDTYLTLSETDKQKCYSALVTLKFDPKKVLLDMTNTNYLNAISTKTTNINGSNYISEITFKLEPISSAVVRFYKQDVTKDYTYPIINSSSIIDFESR